ncbi:hypothetical protein A3721_15150 [Sulfitobacter sp. HI0023]|nr:hypothetical protein A3721_15150 [Sulfitobacter sp. HI0023]
MNTAPAETPVSLAEAKAHLRVEPEVTAEDGLITGLVAAATAHLDGRAGILGRCIVTQTWVQKYDHWHRIMRLPFPDVQSVAVSYVDLDGAAQTVAPGLYTIQEDAIGGYVRFEDAFARPSIGPDVTGVSITFDAGFGVASNVPSAIKAAILLHIGTLYEYRETMADGVQPTNAHEMLIAPYRRVSP